jgi:hypothetical protein
MAIAVGLVLLKSYRAIGMFARVCAARAALLGVVSVFFGARVVNAEAASLQQEGRLEAGIGLRFMPIGWFDLYDGAGRTGFRAYPALGLAPFVDYRVNPYFSVGVSPELTFNVIPNRSDYVVGEMLVADIRTQVRYPNDSGIEPYAAFNTGYSVIRRSGTDSARGAVLTGGLGARFRVSARQKLFFEVDYQRGFQSIDNEAYAPSYLIVVAGWQTRP